MSGTWVTTVFRQIRTLVDGPGAVGQADESLLEQFLRHRDEPAFATLVKRHGPMVMGACLRILGDKHLAEDAFQATFLALALKVNTIRQRGAVAGWLHAVAIRVARKLKAESYRSNKQFVREASQPSWDTPMEASKREERDLVDDELERLPDKYRLPLLLCYFEGRTLEEAAVQLGWTTGKVKGLLDRGRERLRFRLIRRGVTLSTAATATLLAGTALAARVPPTLAASTVQAALNIASGQTLAACGATELVIHLTKGALIMGPSLAICPPSSHRVPARTGRLVYCR